MDHRRLDHTEAALGNNEAVTGRFDTMRTIWRLLRTGLLWLCALVLGFVAVVVAINAFDEDLAPETEALLAAPPNRYAPEQNLYLSLMGMEAPAGESSITVGQARLDEYERHLEATIKDPRLAVARLGKKIPKALAFKGKIDFCHPLTASCWTGIESHKAEIKTLIDDNRELYQRYLNLKGLPGYYETATPSMYAPLAFPSPDVRSLFLADLALRMKSGNATQRAAALADLEGDLQVWRTMLIGDGSLISKMVAVANLQGDYLMLADMIADSSIDLRGSSSEIEHLIMPFDRADWKIGKFLGYEFRSMAPLWEQMDPGASSFWAYSDEPNTEPPNWWQRCWNRVSLHFFQRHATENLNATTMLQIVKVADADPAEVHAARDAHSRWVRENLDFGIRYAYNPIGKILVAIGAPAYESYPLRALDAAAVQRLVRLSYEIRRHEIAPREIAVFIEQHPELATHPADGEPFSWDADKGEIAMKPVAEQRKDRRFSISVWKGT